MPTNKTETDANATPGHVASTDLFGVTPPEAMERSATLSACRTYRYALSTGLIARYGAENVG